MASLLQVTAEQINSINSPELLVDLLRKLLHAEARAAGIARRGVSVPAQITVSDDGEDARVDWQDGPAATDYLPARACLYQSKATNMPKGKCKEEVQDTNGNIKLAIRDVLQTGGAYIVFSTDKNDRSTKLRDRLQGIKDGLQQAAPGEFPNARVDFYGANKIRDWVNQHPAVVAWALRELFGRPVSGLQSWESWSQNPDIHANRYQFVDGLSADGSLDLRKVITEIRQHLSKPQSIARIVGLSGLGKTRVALEAFRPPDPPTDSVGVAETASVIYLHAYSAERLVELFHDLRTEKAHGIFVIDDCDINLHRLLGQIVQHPDSNLSLLTLDFDPASVGGELRYIELKPLDDRSIKGILAQAYQGLSESEIERICRFAQGFPGMAVLLGDAALTDAGRAVALGDDLVLTRLVWGRKNPDQVGRSVLSACSLFDTLGVDGGAKSEMEFVAQELCGIPWERYYEWVQEFQRRPLIQRRGDYIQVLPKPLALRLAGERWEGVHPETARNWFKGSMPERLRAALCDQLALLDFHPNARTLVAELCGSNGPFSDPEVLNTEAGSRCFRSLVEANPEATLDALTRAFGSKSPDELIEVNAGRRNLIWALEKLSFRRETFPRAARLMLAFAAAENETWGNNATGQFVHFFQLYLSATEADGDIKLAIADEALSSGDQKKTQIAVEALGHGLTTWSFTRVGGAERQGTGKALEDWRPSQIEAKRYLTGVLTRLGRLAVRSAFSERARQEISQNFRGLVGAGLIDEAIAVVEEIIAEHGKYWPELLGAIANTLDFDRDRLTPQTLSKLQDLLDQLQPRSLEDRLRFYVTEMPWGYLRRTAQENEEDEDRSIRDLAAECAQTPQEIFTQLPSLLTGSQRNFYPFGHELGKALAESERFIDSALSILEANTSQNMNPSVLGAFLAGLQERRPDLVARALDTVAEREKIQKHLVDLTRFVSISDAELNRITTSLRAGKIANSAVQPLSYGSVLASAPVSAVDDLLAALLDTGGAWVALDIVSFYVHSNKQHFDTLRSRINQILSTKGLLMEEQRHQLGAHEFETLGKKLLQDREYGESLAKHLANEIIGLCRLKTFPYDIDHLLKSILAEIFEKHRDAVWPLFSSAISSASGYMNFHLEHLLGEGGFAFDKGPALLFSLGDEFLLDWCRREQHSAPPFVARSMPLIQIDEDERAPSAGWTRLATAIFDEFGDRKDVLSAIAANMGTFGWTGSLVPYYERYVGPLKSLASHHNAAVREFARIQLGYFEETIRVERKRDEERDFGLF